MSNPGSRIRAVALEAADDAGTAGRILDVAERLVQLRGFNGFSYGDVASELKVTRASLHYHFHGKAELGQALIPGPGPRCRRADHQPLGGRDAGGAPLRGPRAFPGHRLRSPARPGGAARLAALAAPA